MQQKAGPMSKALGRCFNEMLSEYLLYPYMVWCIGLEEIGIDLI